MKNYIATSDNNKTKILSDKQWQEAKRRFESLKELFYQDKVPLNLADEAAQKLSLSSRTVYHLIAKYKESGGLLSSLAPAVSSGGKNKKRLAAEIEQVIAASITNIYLSKQKLKVSVVVEDVLLNCHKLGLAPPSENTIRARIRALRAEEVTRRRQGAQATLSYQPIKRSFPEVTAPLEVFQIDHTKVDIMIVDEIHRKPIGRPYLTVAIDVYSRCITGICLSLEPPSAVSVGLCLSQAVYTKEDYLILLGIEGNWPIFGKPKKIYVDNGAEFHSEALRRGCEQHGITLEYRPVGQPHYGGIIERVIGTFMHKIHSLPGTTFSNTKAKGSYNSEKQAVFTLKELERWLVLCIVNHYHLSLHKGIGEPPLKRWQEGIKKLVYPPMHLHQSQEFLIDFLPIVYRGLQRQGFVIDHISYYNPTLKFLISDRHKYGRFLIRRDPRNISYIFMLNPDTKLYEKIGYRSLNYPAVSLWEHQQAAKDLRKNRKAKIDEAMLFQTIEDLRKLTDDSLSKSKSARRKNARRPETKSAENFTEPSAEINYNNIKPFEDVEYWD